MFSRVPVFYCVLWQGTNISELQESILVTAELADLRADYDAPPRGLVLETKVKQGFG